MKVNIEVQSVCTPTPRGISRYVIELTRKLIERKRNEYSLSFFDKGKERGNRAYVERYFDLNECDVFECNSNSYKQFLTQQDEFAKTYNEYTKSNADVYHFPNLFAIPDNIVGKMIVTLHDMIPILNINDQSTQIWHDAYHSKIWNIGVNRLNRIKPIVITDSQSAKNDICNLTTISAEDIIVIPLSYDSNNLYPDRGMDLYKEFGIDGQYLLFLGAVGDPRKGVSNILSAFEKIALKYDMISLVIAGNNNKLYPELKEAISNYSFISRVIFTGFVTEEQKRALFSSAAVFLFPSEYEGFGLPVLEAMACGAPVITTNVSSLPEVGGDAAVYVSPRNSEQLAHEIERLLNSEDLRNEYIKRGFKQAQSFSWDKTAQMTEEVYKTACERGR